MKKQYTNMIGALNESGIRYRLSSNSEDEGERQITITIEEEQGDDGVDLYYNISSEGEEYFVCQE